MKSLVMYILLTISVTGCAVFTEKKNPNLISSQVLLRTNKAVAIKIFSTLRNEAGVSTLALTEEIKDYVKNNEKCIPIENKKVLENDGPESVFRKPYLGRVLCESLLSVKKYGQFQELKFLLADESSTKYDYLIEINWDVDLKTTVMNTIWHVVNYASLTIIPFRGERDYKLNAKVVGPNGIIKTYSFNETMIDWSHIFLLPAVPFIDGYREGTAKIHENLIANLLSKIDEDKIF